MPGTMSCWDDMVVRCAQSKVKGACPSKAPLYRFNSDQLRRVFSGLAWVADVRGGMLLLPVRMGYHWDEFRNPDLGRRDR